MTGAELREVMTTVLPDDVLLRAIDAARFQQRERRRDALKLVRAMIVSASSPSGGRQADVMRAYFESGAPSVVRGSFYDWFGAPLEQVMEQIAGIAMDLARQQPRDLPGILGCVHDWRIVDSTTVKLDSRLKAEYPGAGDYAAIKIHKTMSVGCGTTIAYHFSPAREHDSPHLVLDESWRGYGLLIDLGYASLERLRECQRFGVSLVMRLKENWKPKVKEIRRGDVTRTFAPGTDLDVLLADDVLRLSGKAIDAEVVVGTGDDAITMRLVGVLSPKGYYAFYLTNLPPSIGPRQVADLYRVRWEIEINNKLDKSSHRLDEIDSRKPHAVRALLHASIAASALVCTLAHRHQLADRGPVRKRAPLHPGLTARMIATCAMSIAEALDSSGADAVAKWDHLASVIVHMGEDPNWRRKPSMLDQLRGWKPQPSTRRPSTVAVAR